MENKSLVFTATYNESENIKNFLDIALKLHNIDILIVDDNSPDGTAKVVEEYKKKFDQEVIYKGQPNPTKI